MPKVMGKASSDIGGPFIIGRGDARPENPNLKGGVMPGDVKDLPYSPPQGPKGIMQSQTPGLHGSNSGNANQPTRKSSSGGPGLGGVNHGCCGSQGRR